MVKLPERSPTVEAIYRLYEERSRSEPQRDYLGASGLGHECMRKIWMEWRQCQRPEHEGRVLRLFETGHREEDRMIANLEAIGVRVEGRNHEVVFSNGHSKGHLDGVVLGIEEAPKTWHLLECKTASAKNFQKTPDQHIDQMQIYMGLSGLTRALYMVHCKDNDELRTERINFDEERFSALMSKANAIVTSFCPPDRIRDDPSFYLCKMCPQSAVCHGERFPDVHCRTCVHATPDNCGEWRCWIGREMNDLCGRSSSDACSTYPDHIFTPGLVDKMLGEPIAWSREWIEYEDVINVGSSGFPASEKEHRTSHDLRSSPIPARRR